MASIGVIVMIDAALCTRTTHRHIFGGCHKGKEDTINIYKEQVATSTLCSTMAA